MAEVCSGIGSLAGIYKFLKVKDKNCNGAIEKGKGEGFEGINLAFAKPADINGDGQVTRAELKYYLNFLRPNRPEEIEALAKLQEQNPLNDAEKLELKRSLEQNVENIVASSDRTKQIAKLLEIAADLANLGFVEEAEDVLCTAVNVTYEIDDVRRSIYLSGSIAMLMQEIGSNRPTVLAVFEHIQKTYKNAVYDDLDQLEKATTAYEMVKKMLEISVDIKVDSWTGIPFVNTCLVNNSGPSFQNGMFSFGFQVRGDGKEIIINIKPDHVSVHENKVRITYSYPEPKEINLEFQSSESAASFIEELKKLPTYEQYAEAGTKIKEYIKLYGNRDVDGCGK